MKKVFFLLLIYVLATGCDDETIGPAKYSEPAYFKASRNEEGILLEWGRYLYFLNSDRIYMPNQVPYDRVEIMLSVDDTLDFNVIYQTTDLSESRFLYKTNDTGRHFYFRLRTMAKFAQPFHSILYHVEHRPNPKINQLVEWPYDFLLQAGNFKDEGTSIVYSRMHEWWLDGNQFVEYSALSYDLNNQEETMLVPRAWYPQWSPNNDRLAFQSTFSDNPNSPYSNIGMYLADEDSVVQLTEGENQFSIPVWHPDGNTLVFLGYDQTHCCLYDVYQLEPETLIYSKLSDNPDLRVALERLSFSPDGNLLAFSRTENTDPQNIYAYNLTNGQISPMVESPWIDYRPSFSPDGKYLAFISSRSGYDEIWIKDLAEDRLFQITGDKYDHISGDLVWSPDSRYLYFKNFRDQNYGLFYTPIEL